MCTDFDEAYFTKLKAINGGLKRELETIESKLLYEVEDESLTRCCFDDGDCRKRPQWVEWRPKPLSPQAKQELASHATTTTPFLGEVLRSETVSTGGGGKPLIDNSKLEGALAAQSVGAKSAIHLIKATGSNALINGEGNLFKMSFRTCKLQLGGSC
jgi:hypothetical protein